MPAMPVPSPFPNKESRFGKPIKIFGTAQSALIFTASLIVSVRVCRMKRQAPGRIISIISDASRYGDLGMEIYSGAKAGAAGFMRSVARTMGRHQITANNIVISLTNTPATQAWLEDPGAHERHHVQIYYPRPGEPTDIANMALYLASDAANAQTYPVTFCEYHLRASSNGQALTMIAIVG